MTFPSFPLDWSSREVVNRVVEGVEAKPDLRVSCDGRVGDGHLQDSVAVQAKGGTLCLQANQPRGCRGGVDRETYSGGSASHVSVDLPSA